jgi:hypothetical protein
MTWAPDYCTVAEFKDFVRIPQDDDQDDALIAVDITAASRAVDRAANRQFGSSETPQDRFYTAVWDRKANRWGVDIDDVQDVTGLTVHFDTGDDGLYADMVETVAMQPVNAAANGRPFTRILLHPDSSMHLNGHADAVEVHGIFGWTAVPDGIKAATMLQTNRLKMRRDSPFGIAGSPEIGSELRLLARLDADVDVLVRAYYRGWWAA